MSTTVGSAVDLALETEAPAGLQRRPWLAILRKH